MGAALSALYTLHLTPREIAAHTERGMRSGIGIGAFEQGGLLMDGGRGHNTIIPPILARMEFPTDWRVLLVMDDSFSGVHGSEEIAALLLCRHSPRNMQPLFRI